MTNPDNVGGMLPCPFCGHDESLYIEHVEGTIRHPAYYVRCDYCGAQTGSTDSGEHVKKWNERAELCRAAPAGSGEVEDWMVELFDEVYEREWNRAADEADDRHKAIIGPADRHATREAIAALLRKLQHGKE